MVSLRHLQQLGYLTDGSKDWRLTILSAATWDRAQTLWPLSQSVTLYWHQARIWAACLSLIYLAKMSDTEKYSNLCKAFPFLLSHSHLTHFYHWLFDLLLLTATTTILSNAFDSIQWEIHSLEELCHRFLGIDDPRSSIHKTAKLLP